MRRNWILAGAGAVLIGSAALLGLILFRKDGVFELALSELTLLSVVVGTVTTAFLGFVVAEMTTRSVKRRTRLFLFALIGAVCGLTASVVYGVFSIEEVCVVGGVDPDCLGWSALGLVLNSSWRSLGLLAAVGVILGALAGVTAARLTRGSRAPMSAMPEA